MKRSRRQNKQKNRDFRKKTRINKQRRKEKPAVKSSSVSTSLEYKTSSQNSDSVSGEVRELVDADEYNSVFSDDSSVFEDGKKC